MIFDDSINSEIWNTSSEPTVQSVDCDVARRGGGDNGWVLIGQRWFDRRSCVVIDIIDKIHSVLRALAPSQGYSWLFLAILSYS